MHAFVLQLLQVDAFGTVSRFAAEPGFGIKCFVSGIKTVLLNSNNALGASNQVSTLNAFITYQFV